MRSHNYTHLSGQSCTGCVMWTAGWTFNLKQDQVLCSWPGSFSGTGEEPSCAPQRHGAAAAENTALAAGSLLLNRLLLHFILT